MKINLWEWQWVMLLKAITSSIFSQIVNCDVTSHMPLSTSQTNAQDLSSPNRIIDQFCSPGTCRNGQCYMVGTETHCYCQLLYRGSRCEQVDLTQVSYVIIGGIIIFQWARPPSLIGYTFVYYELDSSSPSISKTNIIMHDNGRAALVGNMKGGNTMYRICIEDEFVADQVINNNAVHYLTNCVNVATQPDYHTLIAWCIAAMLVCVAVLLIYSQKDKIELLYCSTPAYVMFEHENLDKTPTCTSSRHTSGHLTPLTNHSKDLIP